MIIDDDDIRALGRLSSKIEQNKLFKIIKGPETNSIINAFKELELEFIDINQKLCPNSRYKEQVCDICQRYCPVDAISFGKKPGIAIDDKTCLKCGLCGPACPNGVFEPKDPSDAKILSNIAEILTASKTGEIIFQCTKFDGKYGKVGSKAAGKNIILVPCLGRVSETIVLMAHAIGAEKVTFGECDKDCECVKGKEAIENMAILIKHMYSFFEIENGSVNSIKMDNKELTEPFEKNYSRRKFVTDLAKKAMEIYDLGKEPQQDEKSYWHQEVPLKRRILLQLAEDNKIKNCVVKKDGLPFADLSVDANSCDLCGACSVLCPTGALAMLELDEKAILYFSFKKCTGCDLCVRCCPNDSIVFKSTIDPGKLNGKAVILVKHELTKCPSCGLSFVEQVSSHGCPHCDKRKEVQKNIENSLKEKDKNLIKKNDNSAPDPE